MAWYQQETILGTVSYHSERYVVFERGGWWRMDRETRERVGPFETAEKAMEVEG